MKLLVMKSREFTTSARTLPPTAHTRADGAVSEPGTSRPAFSWRAFWTGLVLGVGIFTLAVIMSKIVEIFD